MSEPIDLNQAKTKGDMDLELKIKQLEAAIEMAANDDIFFNWDWWEDDVKNKKREAQVVPLANLNDTFAYATADAETIPWKNIIELRDKSKVDKWALTRWAIEKRGQGALPEVMKVIKKYDEDKSVK
jgi:hypothetical protein